MKSFSPEDPSLQAIVAKVLAGQRLDREDGLALYHTRDLLSLGRLANDVCERRHGNRTYWSVGPQNASEIAPSDCGAFIQELLDIRLRHDGSQENSIYEVPVHPGATGFTHLKNIAVARLLLDNVKHISIRLAPALSRLFEVALCFGADMMTGASRQDLERVARAAGREPVAIDPP